MVNRSVPKMTPGRRHVGGVDELLSSRLAGSICDAAGSA